MIEQIDYEPNQNGLLEIQSIETGRESLEKRLDVASTVDIYLNSFLTSCSGLEFLDKVQAAQPMKIWDIGFGAGETSLYLAEKGHEVHALDPSPLHCEILQNACIKYGLKIGIYQGVAEYFDQIPQANFDLCIFNSSLHHCDDPIKALQICKNKLKKGGKVVIVNEPILKFYRSKKWFYQQLEKDPVSMGHYGGNEHIYYLHEYLSFLKKGGFQSVQSFLHVKNREPRLALAEDMHKKISGKYVCSDRRLLIKFAVLCLLKNLWRKPLTTLAKKISLFSYSFEAS